MSHHTRQSPVPNLGIASFQPPQNKQATVNPKQPEEEQPRITTQPHLSALKTQKGPAMPLQTTLGFMVPYLTRDAIFYLNCCTGESSWLHPVDSVVQKEVRRGFAAAVGGVLIGLHGESISFFSGEVPGKIVHALAEFSEHPVFEPKLALARSKPGCQSWIWMHRLFLLSHCQACGRPWSTLELIPVLISMLVWSEWIKHSQVVFYLDNKGARHSLIAAGGGQDHRAQY